MKNIEDKVSEFRKEYDELELVPKHTSIKNLEREMIIDWWLKVVKEAQAHGAEEERARIIKITTTTKKAFMLPDTEKRFIKALTPPITSNNK